MLYLSISFLLLTILINIFFGLAVLLRVYQKVFGWYFVTTVFGITLWAIGDLGLLLARDLPTVHWFAYLFYIAPMITPISIWLFAITFPDDRRLPRWVPWVPIVPFSLVVWLFLTHFNFFVHSITITNTLNIATPEKPGYYFYAAYFSGFFLFAYIAFLRRIHHLKGLGRTQEKYIFYGVLFGSFLALLSNLSLPLYGIRTFIWLGPFFSLIFPSAVTVAIVRHRLFNIRLVLARSVGYILTIASLAVVYGLVSFSVVNKIVFPDSSIGFKQQLTFTVLAVSLAFSFYPLRRFFGKQTNRFFYQDAYEPSAFIDQLNRTLVANIEFESMLREAARVVQTNLKTEFCVFSVTDSNANRRIIGIPDRDYTKGGFSDVDNIAIHLQQRVMLTDTNYHISHQDRIATSLNRNGIAVLARIVPEGELGRRATGYLIIGNKKSGNPFTSEDGKIIEIIVNEMVISIQNALRFQEIQNFNTTLQEKIEDATRQLRRTNDKLRKLDETKDDFISMASHQLRTPLTSVKGYVSMVLDGDAGTITKLQRKLLTQSFISSQRMVYLISDLLNVSRLKTGKFVIEPVKTNLADVIQEEVEQLIETVKGRNLELTYHKPEHFPVLMMDETKIRQVIMNFVDNAIYYTPSGGHITVSLVDHPKTIEFMVTDDGIGVPRHEQLHLFTKFFRAHNAKRARPDGTGLGLFMAKKVIIAQGGALIFKSQEGKGSTFGFTFAKAKLVSAPADGIISVTTHE